MQRKQIQFNPHNRKQFHPIFVNNNGNNIFVSPNNHSRKYFSDQSSDTVFTLLHQTDLQCAEQIISSQIMKPGTDGLFGAGIYFANTIEATDRKCHRTGVYLIAEVDLGKTVEISKKSAKSQKINTQMLVQQGYDSVTGRQLPSGREYVVFSPKQVRNIKYVLGNRPQAVLKSQAYKIVLFFVTDRHTAKKIVESKKMIKSNGKFGRAYYMYDTIADAISYMPNETYLSAEVEMDSFCKLRKISSIYDQPDNYKTFLGRDQNINVFIIKYKSLITRIHYCGGKPWNTD